MVYNLEGSSVSADPSSAVRKPAAAHTAAATASAGVDETAFDEDAAAEGGEELGAMTTSNAQPVHTEYNQVPENDSEDAGDGDGDDTAEGQVIGNENEQELIVWTNQVGHFVCAYMRERESESVCMCVEMNCGNTNMLCFDVVVCRLIRLLMQWRHSAPSTTHTSISQTLAATSRVRSQAGGEEIGRLSQTQTRTQTRTRTRTQTRTQAHTHTHTHTQT